MQCKVHNIKLKKYKRGWVCGKCTGNKTSEQRRKNKIALVNLFGGKCSQCGYNKCISALTFHHTNPSEKSFSISSGDTKSFTKLLAEAKKCELLCHNCHSERHASAEDFKFHSKSFKISPIIRREKKLCKHCNQIQIPFRRTYCSKKCMIDNGQEKRIMSKINKKKIRKIKKNKTQVKSIKIANAIKFMQHLHFSTDYILSNLNISQSEFDRLIKISVKIKKELKYVPTQVIIDKLQTLNNLTKVGSFFKCSGNAVAKRLKKDAPEILKEYQDEISIPNKKCELCLIEFKPLTRQTKFCSKRCIQNYVGKRYQENIGVIITLLNQGKSMNDISKIIKVPRRTVNDYVAKYKREL